VIPRAPQLPTRVGTSERPARSALVEQTAQLERTKQALVRAEEKVRSLVSQTNALETRAEQAEQALADRGAELELLERQHDSLRSLVSVRAERIRELEQALGQRERAVIDIEERLTESVRGHGAELEALRKQHALHIAQTRLETIPPPSQAPDDDMRAIKGIGPKFEILLREHGIRRYQQIANWRDDDVARIAAQLGVNQKRIERDGWIESARALLTARGETPDDELNW
jgi:predicted flap endonuclease-1-like 5' DNA nuclease